MFYLVMVFEFFGIIVKILKLEGVIVIIGWFCFVIEKLFGYDLLSVQVLNKEICEVFMED